MREFPVRSPAVATVEAAAMEVPVSMETPATMEVSVSLETSGTVEPAEGWGLVGYIPRTEMRGETRVVSRPMGHLRGMEAPGIPVMRDKRTQG